MDPSELGMMMGNQRFEFVRRGIGLESDLGIIHVSGEGRTYQSNQSLTLYERGMIVDGWMEREIVTQGVVGRLW